MASTQFDSTEIQNTTYIPRFVKHEDAPDRMITSMPPAREDGEVLISELYGKKIIRLQGTLIGTSTADLESKIDTFKELFSRQEKNLDIDWNGGTRRYVASCSKHTFDRDHYNTNAVPWVAEFTVISGEGKDTTTTTALNAHSLNVGAPIADSFTMSGSKPAKPLITLTGANWPSTVLGVEYKDTDTGEKLTFISPDGGSFNNTGQIIIDCLLKKVTESVRHSSATVCDFFGVFPKFKIGTNNIQVTAGGIISQSTADVTAGDTSGNYVMQSTNAYEAMSFSVPYTAQSYQGVTLLLKKTGTPGSMTVRIETDTNGSPSGVLADASATLTIAAGSITTGTTYITAYFANPFILNGNTKYWIVVKSAATTDGSNYYEWAYITSGAAIGKYARGGRKSSTDGGATWIDGTYEDHSFRMLYGGVPGAGTATHTVVYTKTYL